MDEERATNVPVTIVPAFGELNPELRDDIFSTPRANTRTMRDNQDQIFKNDKNVGDEEDFIDQFERARERELLMRSDYEIEQKAKETNGPLPVLDTEVVLEAVGFDEEYLADVLDNLVGNAPLLVGKLEKALEEGNTDGFLELLRSLKNSIHLLGLSGLHLAILLCEKYAKQDGDDKDGLRAKTHQIMVEFERLSDWLAERRAVVAGEEDKDVVYNNGNQANAVLTGLASLEVREEKDPAPYS